MTKKTIIIGSAVTAAAVCSIAILKKIRTKKLEKYLTAVFITTGLPNNMASDLAKISIKYRFDHETRDRVLAEYCTDHIDEIDVDHLIEINRSLEDLKGTMCNLQ